MHVAKRSGWCTVLHPHLRLQLQIGALHAPGVEKAAEITFTTILHFLINNEMCLVQRPWTGCGPSCRQRRQRGRRPVARQPRLRQTWRTWPAHSRCGCGKMLQGQILQPNMMSLWLADVLCASRPKRIRRTRCKVLKVLFDAVTSFCNWKPKRSDCRANLLRNCEDRGAQFGYRRSAAGCLLEMCRSRAQQLATFQQT